MTISLHQIHEPYWIWTGISRRWSFGFKEIKNNDGSPIIEAWCFGPAERQVWFERIVPESYYFPEDA